MCGGGGDDGSAEARRREEERQSRIRMGMTRVGEIFSQYDDNFFNRQRDKYVQYATPQLNEEMDDASLRLTAALSRSGALKSSEAAKRSAKLQRDFQLQRQAVVDRGSKIANQSRGDLENARSSIISDLYATADPAAAGASAVARAKIASQDPEFSPVGGLFEDITKGLADWQEARSYNRAFSSTAPGASRSSDSGRNVRG